MSINGKITLAAIVYFVVCGHCFGSDLMFEYSMNRYNNQKEAELRDFQNNTNNSFNRMHERLNNQKTYTPPAQSYDSQDFNSNFHIEQAIKNQTRVLERMERDNRMAEDVSRMNHMMWNAGAGAGVGANATTNANHKADPTPEALTAHNKKLADRFSRWLEEKHVNATKPKPLSRPETSNYYIEGEFEAFNTNINKWVRIKGVTND